MHRFLISLLLALTVLGGLVAPASAAPSTYPSFVTTATAHVSDTHPHHNERVTVTGTLRQSGHGVAGALMTATWHYKTTTSTCTATTNAAGVASCTRSISRATYGYTVRGTVRFTKGGTVLREIWNGAEMDRLLCVVFRYRDAADARHARAARCTITAVTQQWGRVFDDVPHGWKRSACSTSPTVCLISSALCPQSRVGTTRTNARMSS